MVFQACSKERTKDMYHPSHVSYSIWATLLALRASTDPHHTTFLASQLHHLIGLLLYLEEMKVRPIDEAVLNLLRDFYEPSLEYGALTNNISAAANIDCEQVVALARVFIFLGKEHEMSCVIIYALCEISRLLFPLTFCTHTHRL